MPRRSPSGLKDVIRDYRRDQIIAVARRLFGERGTTEISMDDIATAAGVARSTVYVYFTNRDDLLRSCLRQMYGIFQEGVAEAWDDHAGAPARLEAVVRGLLGLIDENPAFFRLAMATQGAEDRAGQAVGAELAVIGLDMAVLLEDLVRQGMAAGTFRESDPAATGKLIGQQLFGAMSVRAGDPAPLALEHEVEDICDFVLRALGPGND